MLDKVSYLEKMERAMEEKIFFLNKIDFNNVDTIVDFGCANGALIEIMDKYLQSTKQIIGFDNYQYFIDICNNKYINNKNLIFISDFYLLTEKIKQKKYAIIFSSCLHELDENSLEKALKLMQNSKYVIIRDMYFDKSLNREIEKPSYLSKINKTQIDEFEIEHGEVNNLKNLYHLFLKYTYKENWKTEVKEDYFSVDYDKILSKLNNFKIIYDWPYTLPFKKDEILKEFNYDLTLPTHIKLILKIN